MNRRTFLAASSAALASAALAQDAAAPKKRHLRKAVNLGMARGEKGASVLDRFKMIQDAGFDGVELNRPDAEPLDDILKARDATGLAIANVICSTHWGKPLSSPDNTVREQGVRGLKLALKEAGEVAWPAARRVR